MKFMGYFKTAGSSGGSCEVSPIFFMNMILVG
jgi:hypothetical protein